LYRRELKVRLLGRGHTWLDTGTHETLVDAAMFVRMTEQRQGLKIACPEEIAFRMGFVDSEKILELSERYNNDYGNYLKKIINS